MNGAMLSSLCRRAADVRKAKSIQGIHHFAEAVRKEVGKSVIRGAELILFANLKNLSQRRGSNFIG